MYNSIDDWPSMHTNLSQGGFFYVGRNQKIS